jgi:hypothetical protein
VSNSCILSKLIEGLDNREDPILRPNQNGFRRDRSTTQCILALQRLVDLAKYSGKKTALLFIDYSDAFNSVYWPKCREVLEQLGVPEKLIVAAMALMHDVTTRVETPNGLTDPINVFAGVLQGDTLAPFLFICVIDIIMRRALVSFPGITFSRVDGSTCSLTDLDYADDLAIFFEESPGVTVEPEVERFLATIVPIAAEYGLKLNFKPKKTEVLYINNTTPLPVKTPDGAILHVTKDYKYLGSLIIDREAEFLRRKSGAWAALKQFKPIWRSTLSIGHKKTVFDALVVSIYMYGMETWSIGTKLLAKITGTYTQMVRFVKNVRVYSAATAMSNTVLFEGLDRIEDTLVQRRLRFAGHCQRSKQPVADLLLAPLPTRTHGTKPTLNMVSVLQADVKRATKSEQLPTPLQLRHLMMDRDKWSAIVASARTNMALYRTPDAVVARIQTRSSKPPHRDLKSWDELKSSGKATRRRELRKAIAARRCAVAACGQPNCQTHCQDCQETHPPSTDWLPQCQLCSMHSAVSCEPHPSDTHMIIDSITPALAETIFLCYDCYVICRHYPMPPEFR